ncbi:ABC transporter ATP-binding protein [Bauldia sp.]|uniref:ABC transporter ATP-binding protein n=1 Tax=Bauldia sp. TaxID=2575872 RepID=UPI003BAA7A0D
MSVVEYQGVMKSFGHVEVIHGIDLLVNEGEFMVFVGPSGCGKSTMLRMTAGLETITEGTLLIDGQVMNDATPVRRGVAMVFQNYALYPNMTVRQNMAFGLEQARVPKPEIRKAVDEAARTLKIEDLLNRRPGQLSGGQSQRVAIGRAIVRNPGIFLFDEPLSNLDAELRVHMRVELGRLHERLGKTMIYVTHDQVEAMTMADRIAVFNTGRIEQVGSPLDLYNNPVNLFVAGFIGSPRMNFVSGPVEHGAQGCTIQALAQAIAIPLDLDAGGSTLSVGVRPEHLEIVAPDAGDLAATVELTEQLGSETFVYCSLGDDEPWVVKSLGQVFRRAGERVGLRIPWDQAHFFGADGKRLSGRAHVGSITPENDGGLPRRRSEDAADGCPR